MAIAGQEVDQLQQFLHASETLLDRVYHVCHGLSDTTQPVTSKFVSTHYEIKARLLAKFPEHPRGINVEKVDRLGSEVLWRQADVMANELTPLYCLLQDVAAFQERTVQFLISMGQTFAPFCMSYTPELLEGYMDLACAAIRLQLLARHMPSKLIIQLYTAVRGLATVQAGGEPDGDPPARLQMVHYVTAFDGVVQRLQSEFQPISSRIGQVLEATAFGALVVLGGLPALQDSRALEAATSDMPDAERQDLGEAARTWRDLTCMDKMRDWAFWGLLVCPGEMIRPGALEACKVLLEDTLRVPVYKEYCEWIHALYEQHVRPTILMHFNQVKKGMAWTDRRALVKSVKSLIEDASQVALGACMKEHWQRRVYACAQLHALVTAYSSHPERLPAHVQQVLAALAYARAELLWHFRHVGEVVPRGLFQSLLSSSQPLTPAGADESVPALLSAMQSAVSLLQQYRSAIQGHMVVCVRGMVITHIAPTLDQLAAAAASGCDKELPYIVEALRGIAAHFQALQLPSEGEAEEEAADLSLVRSIWEPLIASLFTAYAPVSAAELEEAAGNNGVLHRLASLMYLTNLIDGFHLSLQRSASLAELCFSSAKLRASMRNTLEGPAAAHALGYLYALSGFQANQLARQLAEELMQRITERIQALLEALHQGDLAALDAPLTPSAVSDALLAASRAAPALQRAASKLRLPTMQQALPPALLHPGQESVPAAQDSRASLATDLATLSGLVHALSHSPPIPITSSFAIVPVQLLTDSISEACKHLLSRLVFVDKEIQRPSLLEVQVRRFLALLQRLQPFASQDLAVSMREAFLGHAFSDLTVTSRTDSGSARVIAHIAEWYSKNVIQDARDWGVSVSLSRQTFTSRSAPGRPALDVALYASCAEVGALVRVFGVYGARELGRRMEHPLGEALAGLDAALLLHEPLLTRVMVDHQEQPSCYEAFCEAARQVADLDHVLDLLKLISRCCFFRQLVGEACGGQASQISPAVAYSLAGAALDADGHRGPHVCDIADLPRPSSSGIAVESGNADPALVRLLAGDGSPERLHRACADKVYLSPFTPLTDSMAQMLCFVRCASCALMAPGESLGPKLLALDDLVGHAGVDRELLESANMPFTRIRAAYQQACLHRQPGMAW
ncbi:hypothetical protein WJX72_006133 [[Myrmecia] bisecta]|uniref:Uncharacterized protein n=1 Tax=[Myrmecia] bisecta TaxID=41462 RepID=A0AAW1Q0H5_9CHLO